MFEKTYSETHAVPYVSHICMKSTYLKYKILLLTWMVSRYPWFWLSLINVFLTRNQTQFDMSTYGVPVNCETKRETKYTETKPNQTKRNSPKRNEIHRNEMKSMPNEINRNETV